MHNSDSLRAGQRVVLVAIPPGLLDGLPDEDQRAIAAIVGKPIQFVGYDDIGRAELEFDDPFDPRTEHYSRTHTIWVAPKFVDRYRTTKARAKQLRTRLKATTRRNRNVVGQKRRK
jgi:hypothetical protein